MRRKIATLVAGVVIGASAMTVLPVQAHHSDRDMKRRLSRLENQVRVLQAKTVDLDTDGFFWGPVLGSQVIGACAAETPATWVYPPGTTEFTWINDCLEAQQQSARKAQVQMRQSASTQL
jgi:hypothetical protein